MICLTIFSGQLCYLYLNENDGKRDLNVNRNNPDDNWNENVRFLVVRKFLLTYSSLSGKSFFCELSLPAT